MYGGQPVDIVIEFDDKLIGVVYDKFGENKNDPHSRAYVCGNCEGAKPHFWGMVVQFGKQMRILSQQVWSMNRKR